MTTTVPPLQLTLQLLDPTPTYPGTSMTISRRRFLGSAAALSLGFAGLRCVDPREAAFDGQGAGLGPLVDDPEGLMALPRGFRYTVISRQGEVMTDGLLVPGLHDGMAAFPGPGGRTLLVRNHEMGTGSTPSLSAFGRDFELLSRIDPTLLYDGGTGRQPAMGGTTTLVFDTRTQSLESHFLSLAGTVRNCAGGATPWGTWITCEETVERAGGDLARDHGYAFEVPAETTGHLNAAVPLQAMGRFRREAVAIDPTSGVVYQTEDNVEGLLYRFVPDRPGALARGGRLEALAVADRPSLDTRNFENPTVEPGFTLPVAWVPLDDVDAPEDDLRVRGFDAGAARFARGEGIWYGNGEIYFACTNGGRAQLGQIWRYRPSPAETRPEEVGVPGTLELFIEPNDGNLVANADNLTGAPWGDLVICEDGTGADRLIGVTPAGELYVLGRNVNSSGELAGACFSPDGTTLFVNMQAEGLTLAITGPWPGAGRA